MSRLSRHQSEMCAEAAGFMRGCLSSLATNNEAEAMSLGLALVKYSDMATDAFSREQWIDYFLCLMGELSVALKAAKNGGGK